MAINEQQRPATAGSYPANGAGAWTRKLQLHGLHANGSKAQIVELIGLNYASGNWVSQQWLACALDYHRHYQLGTCTVLAG
ncbi:hypothetical protein GGD63_003483 [Bradyrhizobium sp. cir1]|uniref:hypothetical protein n=1 Tax=Bradyrhizobium sp. cir1 TaxID=1445730 RepID=UPI001605B40E|nr:hypothetical protein [Bradyrhizobium sp. cir1]MBB4370688.1 hypothetical protein [Bradyrhizobium sp. cir1]